MKSIRSASSIGYRNRDALSKGLAFDYENEVDTEKACLTRKHTILKKFPLTSSGAKFIIHPQ
jgi:hypothetical protein